MNRLRSIKTLPILTVILGIAILTLVFFLLMKAVLNLQNEGFASTIAHEKQLLWDKEVTSIEEKMLEVGVEFSDGFSLNRALRENSTVMAARLGEQEYEQLGSEGFILQHMWILNKDLETLWEADAIKPALPNINRLNLAIQNQMPDVQLVSGQEGNLSVSGIFPVYIRGELKGMVVMLFDAGDIVRKLNAFDGDGYQLESLEGGILETTLDSARQEINLGVNQSGIQVIGDQYLRATAVLIKDKNQEPVARLINFHDETVLVEKEKKIVLIGILVVLVIAFSVVSIVAILLSRSFNPIAQIAALMETIAGGNLSQDLPAMNSKEMQQLGNATNAMIAALRDLVSQILDITSQLRSEAETALCEGRQSEKSVQDQRNHIEEVGQSMVDLSQSALSLANNIEESHGKTVLVLEEADKGNDHASKTGDGIIQMVSVIESVVSAVSDVERVSEEIGSTLDILNSITEQTDLLALNAAIEAARAGEQGRGFAVVADEVRTLATLARKSTDDIREIIEGLHKSTHSAAELVEVGKVEANSNAGLVQAMIESLNQVKESVSQIADSNRDVARNAERQSTTAQQVKAATHSIRDETAIVSENASRVRASADQIATIAAHLEAQIGHFQLEESDDSDGEVNFF